MKKIYNLLSEFCYSTDEIYIIANIFLFFTIADLLTGKWNDLFNFMLIISVSISIFLAHFFKIKQHLLVLE